MRENGEKKFADYQPFTMEDVQQVLKERQAREKDEKVSVLPVVAECKVAGVNAPKVASSVAATGGKTKKSASMMDILGFDPREEKQPSSVHYERSCVPKKWQPYFDQLVQMRDELEGRILSLTKATLQQGDVENSDCPNMLGQHMADGAAQQVDLELALTFVATEHDLLSEVNQALERIRLRPYGSCQQTGEPIDVQRLEVLPFARFSLKGQEEFERIKKQHRSVRTTSIFAMGEEEGDGILPDGGPEE
jgi:RNA polymerase-binding transcription factor DksA